MEFNNTSEYFEDKLLGVTNRLGITQTYIYKHYYQYSTFWIQRVDNKRKVRFPFGQSPRRENIFSVPYGTYLVLKDNNVFYFKIVVFRNTLLYNCLSVFKTVGINIKKLKTEGSIVIFNKNYKSFFGLYHSFCTSDEVLSLFGEQMRIYAYDKNGHLINISKIIVK